MVYGYTTVKDKEEFNITLTDFIRQLKESRRWKGKDKFEREVRGIPFCQTVSPVTLMSSSSEDNQIPYLVEEDTDDSNSVSS